MCCVLLPTALPTYEVATWTVSVKSKIFTAAIFDGFYCTLYLYKALPLLSSDAYRLGSQLKSNNSTQVQIKYRLNSIHKCASYEQH